ncbi:flagellar basal body P-ring formation chaperone FlgA [Candidatus Paracaedibacter symbiosus]|uniref:flagellar basal body P-ring formation chaperone FlgA n=1 Tax=Candidatus Paracaedibacter symbiosus TaxID=244582 RepID=UPI000509B8B4|nr:flagellar basal body P-ring formation chaperone FlgA [Candidatus Paracaedibacter symbiosus]
MLYSKDLKKSVFSWTSLSSLKRGQLVVSRQNRSCLKSAGHNSLFSDVLSIDKLFIGFLLFSRLAMAESNLDDEMGENVEGDARAIEHAVPNSPPASQPSFSMETIQEALKTEVDKIMQISNEYEINLSTQNINLSKENTEDTLQIRNLSFEPGTYHFHGLLNTTSGQGVHPDIQIRGSLQLILEIPVVSCIIQPEEEITEANITWQKMPLAKVGQGIVQRKDDLVGKTPRNQPIKPGILIRTSDLKSPVLIKKKDTVMIVYRDEGISLSSTGEALQEGAKGDLINILMLNSKKQIQARVKDKGQAEIQVIE